MKTQKRCPTHFNGLGEILPLSEFHKDRTALDGRQSRCKVCLNAARQVRYRKNGSSPRDEFASLRASATRREIAFDLTFEQYSALIGQSCAYGGAKRPEIRVRIDRKDPTGAYTLANAVPCCGRHNTIKSDLFTFDSMVRIAREFPEAARCGEQERRIMPPKAKSISAA